MKKIVTAILVIAMLALPMSALGAKPADRGSIIGMSILGFQTTDINDATVDDSILSNAVVTVFNFWASWCGPCVGEMPSFNQLYNNYSSTPEADVQIIGVMVDPDDYISAVNYVQSHGYNWPQLYRCSKFMEILSATSSGGGISIPQTIVVDWRGDIIAHQIGSFSTYNALYTFVNTQYQYVATHYPPTSVTVGDADGNGIVNGNDALAILRMSLGLMPMGDLAVVDVDGNGAVNANDALIIMRRSLGLEA